MGESYGYKGEITSGPLTLEQAQALYYKVLQMVQVTSKSNWHEFPVAIRPCTLNTSCVVIGKPEPREKQRPVGVQKSLQQIIDATDVKWSGEFKWSGTGCEGDGVLIVEDGVVTNVPETREAFVQRMRLIEDDESGHADVSWLTAAQ